MLNSVHINLFDILWRLLLFELLLRTAVFYVCIEEQWQYNLSDKLTLRQLSNIFTELIAGAEF